jgi:DNA polymerase-3 subunit gamma/tau
VGQSHIVRTLTNAIHTSRIHQAYLFTGSRGVGKTSIARIFAKVIRCEKMREESGVVRSCDECWSCKEISQGNSVDVIEIDGASNNGVEAVREIRENAKYMPSSGQRKVYIIDEVHMLTTAAFNALLKTLEEPPAHVIFIFATTEPHKIPATILSRCQRFDYRRVTVSQIQGRLSEVTLAEKIQAEPAALALIARAAEGSMRDALSLLDQVIAFSGSQITVQSVRDSIGLIGSQAIIGILRGILSRNPLEALGFVQEVYEQGQDLRVLIRSLVEFLHGILLAKVNYAHSSGLEVSDIEWKELSELKDLRSIEEIEFIFQVLHHGLEWIARSPQPKVILDVLIIKCATADILTYIESVPPAGSPQKPNESPVTKAPTSPATGSTTSSTSSTSSTPTPPPSVAASTPTPTAPANLTHAEKDKSWIGFIEHVRRSRPLLASILEHSSAKQDTQLESIADKTLHICFSPEEAYFKEQLQSRAYQEQMIQLTKEYFGSTIRFQIELKNSGESLAAKRERELKERTQNAKERAQNHPIILEAKSLFGGELGPIDLREDKYANLST